MKTYAVNASNAEILPRLQHKIDQKTKPPGALGKLEKIALQIGTIQNSLSPNLTKPVIVVFAGDHGIASEGVSSYPQEVTYQMVYNFLQGGAAINVFARQHNIALKVVDAGVNFDFDSHPTLVHAKVANGTANFLYGPAMSKENCATAMARGADIVAAIYRQGSNVVGFGEMGIGNTSSASLLMSQVCSLPIEQCIGKGTGLDGLGLKRKTEVLAKVLAKNYDSTHTPFQLLQTYGGFEIAMMCGAYLKAAELKLVILVDGFIATSALLIAAAMNEHVLSYCIFSHQSDEQGHELMLKYLHAEPVLSMQMRLGEGTGIAVAYPVIQSALAFLNEMASFESAGVKNKTA